MDFLRGGMPAYLDTGLNIVDADDIAEGHLLAADGGPRHRRDDGTGLAARARRAGRRPAVRARPAVVPAAVGSDVRRPAQAG